MISDDDADDERIDAVEEAVDALRLRLERLPAPAEHKPCVPVAYDIRIVSRDKDGRISHATLTPVKP